MVQEITYKRYCEFSKILGCKDIFFYISNLFVKFEDDPIIYAVKYNINENPEEVYNQIKSEDTLVEYSLDEFKRGFPCMTKEIRKCTKREMYEGKNIIVFV